MDDNLHFVIVFVERISCQQPDNEFHLSPLCLKFIFKNIVTPIINSALKSKGNNYNFSKKIRNSILLWSSLSPPTVMVCRFRRSYVHYAFYNKKHIGS